MRRVLKFFPFPRSLTPDQEIKLSAGEPITLLVFPSGAIVREFAIYGMFQGVYVEVEEK